MDFGLPYIYHQDEAIIVNHGLRAVSNHLDPDFFVIPGFTLYAAGIAGMFVYVAGLLSGFFHSTDDFLVYFLADPSAVYIFTRVVLGVIPGVLCVLCAYIIGCTLFNRVSGSKAALLTALAPILVQHSHYIYTDSCLALGIFVLFWLIISVNTRTPVSRFVLVGFIWGWSISVKYTGLYFLPVILFRYIQIFGADSFKWKPLFKLTSAGLVSVCTFFIFSPYTLFRWTDFFSTMMRQSGAEHPVGLLHHVKYSLMHGVGLPVLLLAVVGYALYLKKSPKDAQFTGLWISVYYLINAFFSQHFARYMLPMAPMLCLLGGYGWATIRELLGKHKIVLYCANIIILASVLLPSIKSNMLFMSQDTRTVCKEWIKSNIPSEAGIAFSSRTFAPRLRQTDEQILQKISKENLADPTPRIKRQLKLIEAGQGDKPYRTFMISWDHDLDNSDYFSLKPFITPDINEMLENGIKYIVIDNQEFRDETREFLSKNSDNLSRIHSFSPYISDLKKFSVDAYDSTSLPHVWTELFSRKQSGPYIAVYRIKDSNEYDF